MGPVAEALAAAERPGGAGAGPSAEAPRAGARAFEVWVVGEATGRAAARAGLPPDLVPGSYRAEGLLEAARRHRELDGLRILFARASEGRDVLPRGLEAAGARVTVLPAYRTVPDPNAAAELARDVADRRVAAVTLTAGSGARSLAAAWGGQPWPDAVPVVALGPPTAAAARAHGIPIAGTARPHTLEGLVAALVSVLDRRVS